MTAPLLIAYRDTVGYQLLAFEGIPTVVPGLIVLEAGPGWGINDLAYQLLKELEAVLRASGPNVRMTQYAEQADNPAALAAFQEPGRQKLLVLICGDQIVADQPWLKEWLAPKADRSVLPLFHKDAKPDKLLPADLQPINVKF